MKKTSELVILTALMGSWAILTAGAATESSVTPTPVPTKLPPVKKIKAVDADNHMVFLNRPGVFTLVIGTNEDSQKAARRAGVAVHTFQGRPDFQLIIVVDLRDSIANWVPSVVLSQMRSSLDGEALELKPFYLKNGNKNNPRNFSHVIADFSGTICPQLGWPEGTEDLRGILFGVDGREIKRWDKLDDIAGMQNDIRDAIQAQLDADRAKAAAAAKSQGSKIVQPPALAPPLQPIPPLPKSDD